jgi:PhzF family phenazine biosynthesis protein
VPLPLFHVDAFAAAPFEGNPAAVCLLDFDADPTWMQSVAAEMNLSETAFVRSLDREGRFALRWFTPTVEVDLCGHATLASAHVLWENRWLPPDRDATFVTRSGTLVATHAGELIELDFPADPVAPVNAAPGLLDALGSEAKLVARGRIGWFVEVADEDALRALAPDFAELERFGSAVVTCESARREYDFVSRYFAPAYGIDEDPVTGAAHCALGPYWSARLGRTTLVGYQASARGGVVRVRAAGDRVHFGGRAVTVTRGELA